MYPTIHRDVLTTFLPPIQGPFDFEYLPVQYLCNAVKKEQIQAVT